MPSRSCRWRSDTRGIPIAGRKPEAGAIGCGIDDTRLDATVEGAIAVGKDVRVPGSAHILQRIDDDMRLMAAPALAAALALGGCRFKDRLAALLAACPPERTTWSMPKR